MQGQGALKESHIHLPTEQPEASLVSQGQLAESSALGPKGALRLQAQGPDVPVSWWQGSGKRLSHRLPHICPQPPLGPFLPLPWPSCGFFGLGGAASASLGLEVLQDSVSTWARGPCCPVHPQSLTVVCMCACMCLCAHVRVCACTCLCACVCLCICVHVCACVHVCMRVYACAPLFSNGLCRHLFSSWTRNSVIRDSPVYCDIPGAPQSA